jgi:hypothetical protein
MPTSQQLLHLAQQKLTMPRDRQQIRSYKYIRRFGTYGFALNDANAKYGVLLKWDGMLKSRRIFW